MLRAFLLQGFDANGVVRERRTYTQQCIYYIISSTTVSLNPLVKRSHHLGGDEIGSIHANARLYDETLYKICSTKST